MGYVFAQGANAGPGGDNASLLEAPNTGPTNQQPQLGGTPWGAESLANALSQAGVNAQSRQAAQVGAPVGMNPGAMGAQQQGLAQLQAQANGQAPSAAGIGQSVGIGQGLGSAFAASRMGAPGAGAALGAMGSQAIGAGGAGRARELDAAQQGLIHGQGAMASQAIQQQQQDQRVALAQAQIAQQQMQSNNASQIGLQGLAGSALLAQLQADTTAGVTQYGNAAKIGVQGIEQGSQNMGNLIGAGSQAAAGAGSLASQYWGQPQVNADTGLTDKQENNY